MPRPYSRGRHTPQLALDTRAPAGPASRDGLRAPGADLRARVIVAAEPDVVRAGLRATLEPMHVAVVGQTGDGAHAVALAHTAAAGVMILGTVLSGLGWRQTLRRVTAATHTPNVLVMSSAPSFDDVTEALLAGAVGFVSADGSPDEIVAAVHAAAAGEAVLPGRIARVVADRLAAPSATPPADIACALSAREFEVLHLLTRGLENNEIAAAISVSPN